MTRDRKDARVSPRDMAAACLAIVALHLGAGVAVSMTSEPTSMAELRLAYAGPPETWPRPHLREGAVFTEFGPLPSPPEPADNPSTPEKIALGRRLFADPILSGSGQIACESCHNRELGFADAVRTSFGHDRLRGRRNTPSLLTAAWMHDLFWDGRSASLEDQALQPLIDPVEMAGDLAEIERRLNADPAYREAFDVAFGSPEITAVEVARALAAFQRSLRPTGRWDRAMRDGTRVLTDQQLQGLHLFRTKAGCANCHNGPLFSDRRFHNEGIGSPRTGPGRDLGRFEITGDPADLGAFRTPSLRGVSRTAPYMHHGGLQTLANVVTFYDAGGGRLRTTTDTGAETSRSPLLAPLGLTAEEKLALVAFLETL